MMHHTAENPRFQLRRYPLVWVAVGVAFLALFLLPTTAGAIAPPTVTSLTVPSGPVGGGTQVGVIGTGFTGTTSVTFGGVPALSFSVSNDSLLYAWSPSHAAGTVDVVVTTGGGSSALVIGDRFTYVNAVWVSGISPGGGPIFGGTLVAVTGSGFLGAVAVTFGGVAGTSISVYSDNYLTVRSPAHIAGIVDVVVWAGGNASPTTPADTFIYGYGYGYGLAVTGLSPSSGPSAGGTLVTVFGSGFTGATMVTFGGVATAFPTVITDGQLIVVAPPHSPGAVDVRVWAGGMSSAATGANVFLYTYAAPVVTGVDPSNGPPSGGTVVTVTGSGFTGATGVSFGGTPGTNLTVISNSRLVVTSPAHAAGTVDVVVRAGDVASATGTLDLFAYVAAPAVNPPARFVGSVTVRGQPAPSGTVVEVHIGSAVCGATTTFVSGGQSRYTIDSPNQDAAHPGCGTDGAAVTFFVGGTQADQTGTWRSYDLNVVNLTVLAAVPTPQAPGPPSAGTGLAQGAGSGFLWLALMAMGAAAVLGGAVTAGHRRRPIVASAMRLAGESVSPAGAAPIEVRPTTLASEERKPAQSWLALMAVGAVAVAVTMLVARKRR